MIFNLKVPLLGFETITKMKLEKIDDVFAKLFAEDGSKVSFTLINPFILRDYSFVMPANIREALEVDDESQLLIYNIVVVNSQIEKSTINFAAPVVFNLSQQTMAQVVLPDSSIYGVREELSGFLGETV
jgi:flagellar assembly factor FliW